ncbi:helix-turn-helix domain-containing protein [Kitasatospora kifunensis]|uniref:Transcriptional regulator with XRE-family HTH domain n=1 Tax=Kitasatospora kifunensis TaxID=58351 RepID=A0A7W7QYA6_KITKI|nr:helix-turn-helix transcriptional regulator [Kitasatospora kifunensis]MBB4922045.1 transcriptional regulator with XRE-family HTH domain [Kitasatospora kifunensis]
MASPEPESIGGRIAACRKLRHLTQRGLAERASISYSLMFQIEQGRKPATSAVLASLARAPSVSVADLTGQPYLDELRKDHLDGLIQPIREALDIYDLGTDPDIACRPTAVLVAQADRICAAVRAGDLRSAAANLPGLITETTSAAYSATDDRLWSALASTYRSAYDVATKLGFHDLSSIALDRMAWASERASDAVSAGTRQYLRSLAYLRAGQYRTGMRLAEAGRRAAEQADLGSERSAITGQLHLGSAVLAARAGNNDDMAEHISEASRIAGSTGEITRVRWLTFGPTNVAVHHTSALIDQCRYAEALAVAVTINVPPDWPASRAAHHHAEIARAQLWIGRAPAAFRSLLVARELAPQQARHSPAVRDTMAGIIRAQRSTPNTVANFAVWLGM